MRVSLLLLPAACAGAPEDPGACGSNEEVVDSVWDRQGEDLPLPVATTVWETSWVLTGCFGSEEDAVARLSKLESFDAESDDWQPRPGYWYDWVRPIDVWRYFDCALVSEWDEGWAATSFEPVASESSVVDADWGLGETTPSGYPVVFQLGPTRTPADALEVILGIEVSFDFGESLNTSEIPGHDHLLYRWVSDWQSTGRLTFCRLFEPTERDWPYQHDWEIDAEAGTIGLQRTYVGHSIYE